MLKLDVEEEFSKLLGGTNDLLRLSVDYLFAEVLVQLDQLDLASFLPPLLTSGAGRLMQTLKRELEGDGGQELV